MIKHYKQLTNTIFYWIYQSIMENIDDALMRIGVGRFHYVLLLILGSHFGLVGAQVVSVSLLNQILKCYWKLSDGEVFIFTSFAFFGMGIGSLIMGYMGDKYGRKTTLIVTDCALIYCKLMSAISPTFYWITIMEFMNGIALAGLTVSTFPLMSECSSLKYRGTFMVIFQCFIGLGSFCVSFVSWLVLSSLGWRIFLIISTIPIIILLFSLYFVPQSPKYLLLQNEKHKSLKIINYIARSNNAELVVDLYQSEPIKSSYLDLINRKILPITIFASFISFCGTLSIYVMVLLIPVISSIPHRCLQNPKMYSQVTILNGSKVFDNSCCYNLLWKNYENMFVSASATILIVPLSVLFVNWFGRKKSFAINLTVMGITVFCLNFCINSIWINVLLFINRGFGAAFITLNSLYATEFYPTSIRCLGIGVISVNARIGQALSPIIFIIILKFSFLAGNLILMILSLAASLVSYFLIETKDRPLMENVENSKLSNK